MKGKQHMKKILAMALAVAWLLTPACRSTVATPAPGAPKAAALAKAISFKTATSTFAVNAAGSLDNITANGHNYLAAGQPAPLLQVRIAGQWLKPDGAVWNARRNCLTLNYGGQATVTMQAMAKPTHVTLEIVAAQPQDKIELVWWGPYPTVIGDIIGEVVGVVRDPEFAIGIQALNAKTLGGAPGAENDIGLDGQAQTDPGKYADLSPELNKDQCFRGSTAWPTAFGSVLQAYCRDRSRDRIVDNWGHARYLAPAFNDAGVIGSKIALFAGPAPQALATIGKIEVAEGLPHPLLDGVWGKTSPAANAAYLIVDFGENNIDQAIALTQAAGLRYLYHSSPFETWGHFKLKPRLFPHGPDGLKTCVEKARRAGIQVGFHTLSNFTTPNDPYVTPKPDPRLARIGCSAIAADVDAAVPEIPVEAPDYFQKQTDMNTVVIGDELIHYQSVSATAPWRLLGCKRGAWGTVAAAHTRGEKIGKLMDHGYKVFLTDAALAQEMAANIARLCNHAGIRQLSMDGLEGNWSTGHGQYGRVLFTKAWYDALTPKLRGSVRNDASNPAHFNWHINTYYNWGEPWYAGFRESQTLYRFKNQMFYTRNLLPRMLGWFALRSNTSLADTEWLLARSAGYDAGFALAVSPESAAQQAAASTDSTKENKQTTAILAAIRQWEAARLAGAFPAEIKAQLRDNQREFHLEAIGPNEWDLYPVNNGQRGTPVRIKGAGH
jgi:hypothetical protein